jgi:hypothetical protein
MPNIERIIVATSPFQEFIMTTRRVYRWEKPAETSKYLVIYILLWYFDLILPGVVSFYKLLSFLKGYVAELLIISCTLQRRFGLGFSAPPQRFDTLLYASALLSAKHKC